MNKEKRLKKNFKNHIATINKFIKVEDEGIDIEVLTWKEPETSSYMIKYIVTGNTLCVYGDLGEAIYRWSEKITFEWLSGLDLSYFAGKCKASEVGRDFKEWDQYQAFDRLKDFSKEGYFKWLEFKKEFKKRGGDVSLYDSKEWYGWLRENGEDVLGEHWWEWACNIGFTTNTRCIYHFLGLKMAMEQIKECGVNKQ